jgi:hypothetical protein
MKIRVSVIYYCVDPKDVELHHSRLAGSVRRIEIVGDHGSGIGVCIRRRAAEIIVGLGGRANATGADSKATLERIRPILR